MLDVSVLQCHQLTPMPRWPGSGLQVGPPLTGCFQASVPASGSGRACGSSDLHTASYVCVCAHVCAPVNVLFL